MCPRKLTVSLPRMGNVGVFLLLCVVTGGCNRSGLNLAPVQGVVKYKGSPVAGAGVLFLPSAGPIAMGTTDANGSFTLMTANEEGAVVGEHRVVISKTQTKATPVPGQLFPRYDTVYLIPQKYGDATTSELIKTVVDDDNEFEFDLM